jgi:hypothetical protein
MAKFVETFQGCFFHESLPQLFKELNFMKNSSAMATKRFFNKNLNLKKIKARA